MMVDKKKADGMLTCIRPLLFEVYNKLKKSLHYKLTSVLDVDTGLQGTLHLHTL